MSKTKTPELIMEAYNAGQRDFGENYVRKQRRLDLGIRRKGERTALRYQMAYDRACSEQ